MVRKLVIIFIVVFFCLSPSLLLAQDKRSKSRTLEFGLMHYHFDYEEDLSAPLKSTENGWLPGFYLGYAYNKKDSVHTKAFLEYSRGDVEYDGSTLDGSPISFSDNPQEFFRFEWDLGYSFDIGKGFSLAPYTGYGCSYWERGEAKITSTYFSYREKYIWHYIPVGIKADFQIDSNWSIEANIAARFMFDGKMRIYFSELDSNFNNPRVDLGNKVGWFVEIPIRYRFWDSRSSNRYPCSGWFLSSWSLVVTPWYEYSEIGKSNKEDVRYMGFPTGIKVYEPASTTHQYGIKFGLSYSF